MERIPGPSLYKRLNDLPLPYDEVASLGQKIALALHDLHRQHVIHLDLKPSNILFRASGEAVLIDFGLSHHTQLPDLMQEEFRLPYGTAPYMAPEQIMGNRSEPRSDIFSLGVLLYFFSTGERPFGEGERMSTLKKRLWRDPKPPRQMRADFPPWLQEIIMRCLEVDPEKRYPTASQLAFDLGHQNLVAITERGLSDKRDSWLAVTWRRMCQERAKPETVMQPAQMASTAPILLAAIDLAPEAQATNNALKETAARFLSIMPAARLACVNVLKLHPIAPETTLDEQGHNRHLDRLIALRHWAASLGLPEERVSFHVLEAFDTPSAILTFADDNLVDHILIGARQQSLRRALLGGVSAKVAAAARCTVTVVRPARAAFRKDEAELAPETAASAPVEA
jgi:nucleotide-binding universal stress UspA family protein